MITSSLKVFLWDKEIGRLSWDARRGNSYFEYNYKFLTEGLNPFPLLASVDSPTSKRPIMGDKRQKYTANCLLSLLIPFLMLGVIRFLNVGVFRII